MQATTTKTNTEIVSVIVDDNAYSLIDGVLFHAPVFVNGDIDDTCWCEVMENNEQSQKARDLLNN